MAFGAAQRPAVFAGTTTRPAHLGLSAPTAPGVDRSEAGSRQRDEPDRTSSSHVLVAFGRANESGDDDPARVALVERRTRRTRGRAPVVAPHMYDGRARGSADLTGRQVHVIGLPGQTDRPRAAPRSLRLLMPGQDLSADHIPQRPLLVAHGHRTRHHRQTGLKDRKRGRALRVAPHPRDRGNTPERRERRGKAGADQQPQPDRT